MEIEEAVPDILAIDTRICVGIRHPKPGEEGKPAIGDQFTDGALFKQNKCIIVYGNKSREEILREWAKITGIIWKHQSGGWGNPLQQELLTEFSLPGDIPLYERTVGDVMEARDKGLLLPFFHDYLKAWEGILKKSAKWTTDDDFRKWKIGDILPLGAPAVWELVYYRESVRKVISPSTQIPYEGQAFDQGFLIFDYIRKISNTTGSRGDGTFALNCLLVYLRHTLEEAMKFYVDNAHFRAEMMKKQNKSVLYSESDIEILAKEFFASAKAVKADLEQICADYDAEETEVLQYPVNIAIVKNLPQAISSISAALPRCAVKTNGEWDIIGTV